MSNTINVTKTTSNIALKRGLEINTYHNDLTIYEAGEERTPWLTMKPSDNGEVLQLLGFQYDPVDDFPATIPNDDEAIRNMIKELAQFIPIV